MQLDALTHNGCNQIFKEKKSGKSKERPEPEKLIWQLCLRNDHGPIIEVGGKETYTFHQLLEIVPNCKKILPFLQPLFNWLYPLISSLFPSLLDKEQQILLQQDNVADTNECESILGRPMASTIAFWKAELI